MACGSDVRSIDLPTKIKLLDGDIRSQINLNVGTLQKCPRWYQYNRYKEDVIYNMHIDFLNSGSNFIRTNTYHALYPYLNKLLHIPDYAFIEVIENAVQIAQESIRDYCSKNNIHESSLCIVGSCGCFDNKAIDSLQPHELRDAHRDRIRILTKKGIKMLSLEGIQSPEEAEMLLDIVMQECPDTKTLVMFDGKEDLRSLLKWTKDCYNSYGSQITAIGLSNINGAKAGEFCEIIRQHQNTENLIPLVICTIRDNVLWNPINVNNNAPVTEWHKFGIRFIGGCDYVISEDIKSLREKLNSFITLLNFKGDD